MITSVREDDQRKGVVVLSEIGVEAPVTGDRDLPLGHRRPGPARDRRPGDAQGGVPPWLSGLVLVTGGVRSGKSAHAEALLADRADHDVRRRRPDLRRRRLARSGSPATASADPRRGRRVETSDVAVALAEATGPVLARLPRHLARRDRRRAGAVGGAGRRGGGVRRRPDHRRRRHPARRHPPGRDRHQRGRPRRRAGAPVRPAVPRPARHHQPAGRRRLRRGAPRGGRPGAAALDVFGGDGRAGSPRYAAGPSLPTAYDPWGVQGQDVPW